MTPNTQVDADQRQKELEENAQIAYEQVPTQQEMLNGGKAISDEKAKPNANPAVTNELDELNDEAAEESNLGGG